MSEYTVKGLKQGDNRFELEKIEHEPEYVLLTTIFDSDDDDDEDDYLNCDWGFSLEEFQEFVNWINRFNEEINHVRKTTRAD